MRRQASAGGAAESNIVRGVCQGKALDRTCISDGGTFGVDSTRTALVEARISEAA
jgi:hypothetical protein